MASTGTERLPQLAHEVAREWGIELGPPFALSLRSFVAPAGGEAVLKLTPADDEDADQEADALSHWNGDGAVRIVRRHAARRALLLQRLWPGTDIAALPDDEATAIAIAVGRKLWRPAGAPFRRVVDELPRWLTCAEGAGSLLVPLARELLESLDVGSDTLVHGDFHHHNILRASDRFVAIDPKPMLAEPEWDIPTFLWNPVGSRMTVESAERRLAAFAAAGLDGWRMRVFAVVRGAALGADAAEASVLQALLRRGGGAS